MIAILLLAGLTTVCFADQGHEDGDSPIAETVETTEPAPECPVDNGLTSPDTGVSYVFAGWILVLGFTGVVISARTLFD